MMKIRLADVVRLLKHDDCQFYHSKEWRLFNSVIGRRICSVSRYITLIDLIYSFRRVSLARFIHARLSRVVAAACRRRRRRRRPGDDDVRASRTFFVLYTRSIGAAGVRLIALSLSLSLSPLSLPLSRPAAAPQYTVNCIGCFREWHRRPFRLQILRSHKPIIKFTGAYRNLTNVSFLLQVAFDSQIIFFFFSNFIKLVRILLSSEIFGASVNLLILNKF